ncbi:hypothetical protein RB195_025661 [Necator americanus]|uniref:Uncharacterized protein n=1 Tax=Necator americanus TaxID=51031 RepID=A0ABR1ETB1_NECAM
MDCLISSLLTANNLANDKEEGSVRPSKQRRIAGVVFDQEISVCFKEAAEGIPQKGCSTAENVPRNDITKEQLHDFKTPTFATLLLIPFWEHLKCSYNLQK